MAEQLLTEKSVNTPFSSPSGVAANSNDSVWVTSRSENTVNQLANNGNLLRSFASPAGAPVGLGVDSNGDFWVSCEANNRIYQVTESGHVLSSFKAAEGKGFGDVGGVAIDGEDNVWYVEGDEIFKASKSGEVLKRFRGRGFGVHGLDIDPGGSVWQVDDQRDRIYRLNQNGEGLARFNDPDHSGGIVPWGIGSRPDGLLWHSTMSTNTLWLLRHQLPPVFSIQQVHAPPEVAEGDPVEVIVDIENTGGAGTETLDLSTSDTLIGSRSITLDGGESASTELVWTPPAPGVYTVCGAIQESERCTEINVTEARCTVNSFLQSQGIDAEVPVVGETPCLLALLGGIGVGITLLAVD